MDCVNEAIDIDPTYAGAVSVVNSPEAEEPRAATEELKSPER